MDGGEEKGGTTGKRRERAEQREKKIEEGSERRESQNKNSETASENLVVGRSRKWEDRRRLEREGDEILELLEKHEKKEAADNREKKVAEIWARREEKREKKAEERWIKWRDRQRWEEKREKKAEERWTKWEDRQRLERQGDEIVDMIRRHEEKEEEEKRRQSEGMPAGDEYRMMSVMAEKHAREVSEHREMVEDETQKGRKEAREKVVVEMEEMIEKGYGNVNFSGVKESGRENILNVKRENWKREHRDRRAPAQKWCVEREQSSWRKE